MPFRSSASSSSSRDEGGGHRPTITMPTAGGGNRISLNGLGSSGSVLEFLGAVSHFQNNIQRYRWYVLSVSTIRFLSVLNITYSIVGIIFITLAQFPPENLVMQQGLFARLGVVLLFFSPMALIADLLALHGLRQYKRVLLLPWLVFYAVMLALAFSVFLTEIFHNGVRWHLLVLGLVALMMFTRWRHINLQFKLMSVYPDRPTEQSISELAAVVTATSSAAARSSSVGQTSDLLKNMPPPPPKYEDLEQPPQYEDVLSADAAAAAANATNSTAVQDGAAGGGGGEARPIDRVRTEDSLADLEAILPALEGQEKTDCQNKIDQLKAKLNANNAN